MEIRRKGKLFFMCGKLAAGKSTLSKELAGREDAVLFVQDDLLVGLFPGEIVDLAAFVRYSTRIQDVLAPHICSLLNKGVSVVLDFPANTRKQRTWFHNLIEQADAEHELHFIIASDDLCKRQLKQRSEQQGLPLGTKWTTDADFDELTTYFDPPSAEEHFNVVHHERT